MPDAAVIAASRVAAVADDPAARLALIAATYDGPTGHAPRHAPFRRAGLSFMRWEAERGVLNAPDAAAPGSPWWRALNDRLLRDGCEAVARAGGHGGSPSSPTVLLWDAFVGRPTAATWYCAHNASIVSAYLEHRALAERETRAERFFLNVVLSRVLYAHALVAAPRLALGRLGPVGLLLGDPRLGMVGVFLSMRRVLPRRYPIAATLDLYLEVEQELGRILDFGVIQPRLTELYRWSGRRARAAGARRAGRGRRARLRLVAGRSPRMAPAEAVGIRASRAADDLADEISLAFSQVPVHWGVDAPCRGQLRRAQGWTRRVRRWPVPIPPGGRPPSAS